MLRVRLLVAAVLGAAALTPAAAAPARAQSPVTAFGGSYAAEYTDLGAVRDCSATAGLVGREPADGGRHPVFVYLPGTGEPYDGPVGAAFLDAAAARGFVAVSVAYSEWQFYAAGIEGNAACIFGGGPASAIGQACARPSADCSLGVVVAGFSQGASIGVRARNFDARVRAAYLLGFNEERASAYGAWTMAITPPAGTRALPNDRIRIVDGLTDAPVDRRDELNDQTGRSCDVTATSCLGADGSGWYVVQDAELADGLSEHCYFWGPRYCPTPPPFDPTWLHSTTAAWALAPNLAWLASHTGFEPQAAAGDPAPAPPTPAAATPAAPSVALSAPSAAGVVRSPQTTSGAPRRRHHARHHGRRARVPAGLYRRGW